jgi:hypothetical protein
MPAGEYWVGDPCYAVADERWMEWLEAADYMSEPQILLAELDGKPVIGISTAYGDGEYLDEQGRSYPVDAGLIGLTPVELVTGEPSEMHKVTFANDITCSYDDGTINLGNISIDTDPDETEDSCWRCGYAEHNCQCEDD